MIREAKLDDLKNGLLECLSELYDIDYQRAGSVFLERETCNNTFTYVNELKGKIVCTGTLILDTKYGHNGQKSGLIEDVCTLESWQGKGLGREMVQFLINAAKTFGCYKVILCSETKNINFYSKLGFIVQDNFMRLNIK